MSKLISLNEATATYINGGDTIYAAGFTHLIPFAAGHEIIRLKKRDLVLARATPDAKLARAAADAKDLEAVRAAFKPLSEAVAKSELPAGLAVASCPMYKGGSRWVQKQGPIKNPYYGSAMLACGSIEKK